MLDGGAGMTSEMVRLRVQLPRMALYALTLIALYSFSWPLVTGDMRIHLVPWYEHIALKGAVEAFAAPFANYTPPYLYLLTLTTIFDGALPVVTLIKILSVLGVCGLAIAVAALLKTLHARDPVMGGCCVLLLPTVIFNAPMLGQADMFWTAACVMAVAEAAGERHLRMLIWSGVAIAFKAQAVFIAPFVLAIALQRRVPLALWLVPALVYVAAMLPAWVAGWPAIDLLTVYGRQIAWAPSFAGNASNIWSVADSLTEGLVLRPYFWIGFAGAALASAGYLALVLARRLSGHTLLTAAFLSAAILPFLLPKMHERFFFLADILAFALAWVVRTRPMVALAIAMQASSLASAIGVLGWRSGPVIGSALTLVAILIALHELVGKQRTNTECGAALIRA